MDFDKLERDINAKKRDVATADLVLQKTMRVRELASNRVDGQLREAVDFLKRKSQPDLVLRYTPGKVTWRTPRATPMGDGWRLRQFVLMETGTLFVSSYYCRYEDMPRGDWNKHLYDAAARHGVHAGTGVVGVDAAAQPWPTTIDHIVPLPVPEGTRPADHYARILNIDGVGDSMTLGTFPDGTPAVVEKDTDGYHRVETFEQMLTGALRHRLLA